MVDVVAAYQNVALREWDDSGDPLPTSVSINIATAPAAGDVLMALWTFCGRGVALTEEYQPAEYPDLVLPSGAITGCGLTGWQKVWWYNSGREQSDTPWPNNAWPASVENLTGSGTDGNGNIFPYLVRASGTATAGTLTFNLTWPGPEYADATSIAVTVLVIRGLPDLGPDLSYTLMQRKGVPFYTNDLTYDAGGNYSPYGQIWGASNQGGPGNINPEGAPVLSGQVVVSVIVSDHGDQLLPVDGAAPMTALPAQSLGMVTKVFVDDGPPPVYADSWSNGSVLVRYATPSVTTRYGGFPDYGFTNPGDPFSGAPGAPFPGDKGNMSALMLVLGPGSPDLIGTEVTSGVVPMTGSVLGYHRGGTSQDVTFPPGAAVGDLCVVIAADRYLPTFPSGWTTHRTLSGTNQSAKVVWKALSSADISAGKVVYTLAQAGTGAFAVMTFKAGTFRSGSPFQSYVDSIAADIRGAMPYQTIGAGQSAIFYAHGRTANLSGTALSKTGQLLASRAMDYDSISTLAMATQRLSDGTINTEWDANVATIGAYRISFILNVPPAAIIWGPQWDATGLLMVAVYEAIPIAPDDGEYVMTNAPTLRVLATGTPEPFSVQYQTSPTSSFGTLYWSVTITDQVTGEVGATVGTVLQPNARTWWRARAGDGTSWGPWSTPRQVYYYPGRADANEYQHENVGLLAELSPYAGDYMHDNVGLEVTLAPHAGEYLHENVGFQVILSRKGGDYLHENVFIGTPVPHLWFAWLDHGFIADHVWIYGQGLGTVMTEFHASMRMIDSNTHVEHTVSVFDWSVNPGGVDAYDEDRRIYPGTDGVSPVVTVEVTIVEIVIPEGVVTLETVVDYFLARTDGGVSNQIPFLLYPLIPMAVAVAQGNNRSAAALRVSTGQASVQDIEQLYATFAPQAITALGGMLERPPRALVTSRSTFTLGGVSETADLDDPVDTPVPLSARWRPLDASIEPRGDLGTGVSLWTPQSGSVNAWRIVTGTEPYVDEAYAVMSRADRIGRPAMIFPGDAWAELEEALPDYDPWPRFSVVMVAVLHPTVVTATTTGSGTATRTTASTVFGTVLDTAQPVDTYPMALVLDGSQLVVKFGPNRNNFISLSIPGDYLGTRPVIISFTTGNKLGTGRMSLLADTLYTTPESAHLAMAPASRLYLGRDAAADRETRMEVLDVALGGAMKPEQEVALISALDGAYGVSSG